MKRIAVLVDFSPESLLAIRHAANLARRSGAVVVGVHVTADSDVIQAMDRLRTVVSESVGEGVETDAVVAEGHLFESVTGAVVTANPDLVFLCTHGVKGAQHLFGAHIVKLVQALPYPCVVVQRNSVVKPEGYRNILVPASPYPGFERKAEQSATLGHVFSGEVILYEIDKYIGNSSEEVSANLELAVGVCDRMGVPHRRVLDEVSVMSMGYARQTLQYAKDHSIDLIAIMSEQMDSNVAILKADKESVLTNEFGIPVLACV